MTIKLRQKIKTAIGGRGGDWVDLPSLLPAATVLELAGESLRPRLYFATSPTGEELCLRADLTIPAAIYYVENAENCSALTILCEGRVFRAPIGNTNNQVEFTQIGIEKFGQQNTIGADIDVFAAVFEACISAGLKKPSVKFFDGGLMKAILKGVDLPPVWNQYLNSRANSPAALKRGIVDAINHQTAKADTVISASAMQNDEAAIFEVTQMLESGSLLTGAARGAREIAMRLMAKSARTQALPLDAKTGKTLQTIAAICGEPSIAIEQIAYEAKSIGVNLDDWKNDWRGRLKEIKKELGPDYAKLAFEALPNARFEYYDGMVFEIAQSGHEDAAVAFGGRYDGLISALSGGTKSAKAIGATIRPERLGGAQNAKK